MSDKISPGLDQKRFDVQNCQTVSTLDGFKCFACFLFVLFFFCHIIDAVNKESSARRQCHKIQYKTNTKKSNEILETQHFGQQDVRMIALIFVYITKS